MGKGFWIWHHVVMEQQDSFTEPKWREKRMSSIQLVVVQLCITESKDEIYILKYKR